MTAFRTNWLYLICAVWILIVEYFVLLKGWTQQKGLATATAGRLLSCLSLFLFVAPIIDIVAKMIQRSVTKWWAIIFPLLGDVESWEFEKRKLWICIFFRSYTWQWSSPLHHSRRHPWKSRKLSQILLSRRKPNKKYALVLHICTDVTAIKRRLRRKQLFYNYLCNISFELTL